MKLIMIAIVRFLLLIYAVKQLFLLYPSFSGKCLHLSGLTPEPLTADDDYKLLRLGIGFTNMVARATKGSADLTRKEIKEGQYTNGFIVRLKWTIR